MRTYTTKTEMRPVEVTAAESITTALENYSGAAVVLVPDGDQGMRIYYRSGKAGGGGAWWEVRYNDASFAVSLDSVLKDVKYAVLVAREDVDNLISGDMVFMDPEEI